MKRFTQLALFLFFILSLSANDGSYYISGNHLIPIQESDISVRKEILTIKRIGNRQVKVTVYYEFFNPANAKTITVGFEARSPYGDADTRPLNGQHPNMSAFTVKINNQRLPYKVAIVSDSVYYSNGRFKTLSQEEVREQTYEGYADFFYVYHFNATFKKGLNIVEHTYTCDLSGSVMETYSFDYVLTAAMRWANKQIDDFTLIIDMGDYQDFYVQNAPFGRNPDWTMKGTGKMIENEKESDRAATRFYIRKGRIEYKAMNFSPKAELFMFSPRFYPVNYESFDYKEDTFLPFGVESDIYHESVANSMSKRILRNLPFARRGYKFSTPQIQAYYEAQEWYMPDPNYRSSMESLTEDEQAHVKKYSD
ncbi:YARHG domain-containing protein [Dysgonomonas sp. 511]|uniref:YARHG domain-containing protein n=1 Tax=Dysgonomonas sp. 511 TaxID=2302930 RepID=UPI0013CFFBF2|nr:YARHG domain-containing protein [Dysgonomonas sp. 511]NDV77927.1 YARHG domain-containing protein [Dysgonomonas sp. 511]